MSSNPFFVDVSGGGGSSQAATTPEQKFAQAGSGSALSGLGQVVAGVRQQKQLSADKAKKEKRMLEFQTRFKSVRSPEELIQLQIDFPELSKAQSNVMTAREKMLGEDRKEIFANVWGWRDSPNPVQSITQSINRNPRYAEDDFVIEALGRAREAEESGDFTEFQRWIDMTQATFNPKGYEARAEMQKAEREAKAKRLEDARENRKIALDENKLLFDREKWELEQKESEQPPKLNPEQIADAKKQLGNAQSIKSQIDKFLGRPEWIDEVSNMAGDWTPRTTQAKTAVAEFDRLVNLLLMDNLGAMSGALTDKDLEVLQSAATSLRKGMDKEDMIAEINRIKSTIDKTIADTQGIIGQTGGGSSIGSNTAPPDFEQKKADLLKWIDANPSSPKLGAVIQKARKEGLL